MSAMPWNEALLDANRLQAERLAEVELSLASAHAEIQKLKVDVVALKRQLYLARKRQENWLLRQQAWRSERIELLARLAPETSPFPLKGVVYRD